MIVIFSDHGKMTRGCRVTLPSRGDARFGDLLSALQQKGLLVAQSHHNGRPALVECGDIRRDHVCHRAAAIEQGQTEKECCAEKESIHEGGALLIRGLLSISVE